ncbi:single-stranded DNA-binding protein [Arthrobacter sp. L77]|uniref:single-stranded DNA-binding protein n=1 Tax=Arthrobacter sp. L77 TaxID=1496689 RepID=UPI0006915AE9|nr:single-stranded DNA-binding protein [Arthrobacter sp. L77]
MTDIITVRGYVATDVRLTSAQSGLAVAGFRMCSTDRRFDRETNAWVDGHTNWYSVSMFRQLATNAGASLKKGDRVIVTGRLRVRPWTNADGRTGTSVDIDADTAGHDLMWGTAHFKRTTADRSEAQPGAGSEDAAGGIHPAGDDLPVGVDAATGEVFGGASGFDAEPGDDDGTGDPLPAGEAGSGHEDARQEEAVPF